MAPAPELAIFRQGLIFLGAAGVVIPIFHRIKVSPVLGFILVGIVVGPFGVAAWVPQLPWLAAVTMSDPEAIAPAAELGVVMLMFMIGLELSFDRLKVMRRLVFGLGTLQVVCSAAAIGWVASWLGQPPLAAAVIGLALAMSSTAIVLQVLAAKQGLGAPAGRTSFAVLLFQDLAVVPALFAISLLGHGPEGDGMAALGIAVAQAVVAILAVIGFGRLGLRRLFRSVARTDSPELFMAACLLVILATGLATAAAGLSMAMGALIAGLLLAETEYRRQVEVTIEPFKGLLVGVFLISVGMGLDLRRILADPVPLLGAVVALVLGKALVVALLARCFGVRWSAAVKSGLLLGPGGEFGFVILGVAAPLGLVGNDAAGTVLILATVTMTCIPLLSYAGDRLAERFAPPAPVDPALQVPDLDGGEQRVIIAGFGRVGETVAIMLEQHGVAYVAIDNDADRVAEQRRLGRPVYWGDISRTEMLRRLHVDSARALVVTMSDHRAAENLVETARAEREDLLIVVRARDAAHAALLYGLGASDVVPETIEASLQLSEAVLVDVGIPMGPVIASIHEQRALFQAEIKQRAPNAHVRAFGRRRLRDARPGAA
ncbi:cation:proton antiporter domain-containing protein [Limobrevibacterium gyesilva]|uniref:Cation:proton antiporter n=1 Tax=Limobrevibacterium gyesilva TaxID=2991712 RepID=A0AA42CF12_9PROT|nr:cation:proton antiporter [Limobrevibacterium gyesilva]MCW3474256.1 cation:proton antiporter [Limobrevibacterium gyesilva]